MRYEVRDAFELPPTHEFDLVTFGFFLSHVPLDRFEGFWRTLEGVLAPGARIFFVDEGRHFLWREDWIDEQEPGSCVERSSTERRIGR